MKVDGMEKKVNGIENKVDDVIKKEGELEIHVGDVSKQVGDITKQVGDVRKQMDSGISDVKNQINVVDKKVEKVIYNTGILGYKFVGKGYQEKYDAEVYKDGITLKECLEYCQIKRMSDGVEWNGVNWRASDGFCWCMKNDRGNRPDMSDWLHFRAL